MLLSLLTYYFSNILNTKHGQLYSCNFKIFPFYSYIYIWKIMIYFSYNIEGNKYRCIYTYLYNMLMYI